MGWTSVSVSICPQVRPCGGVWVRPRDYQAASHVPGLLAGHMGENMGQIDQEFGFAYVKFETPIRHLRGAVDRQVDV